ncbi:hypothetical protein HK100_008490 [Physocladia obscura]|uniref:Ser-Thr-rich glycosyl-phosphatidyl-inositol-anchored membrane family-domain-containing protein n=1 Tax=Physocladia obscura TaxID=109957 RepID=A0AAD5XFI1_9FUNG|nr:hypothetical protein HK100_008490 [Physocladia obscura]
MRSEVLVSVFFAAAASVFGVGGQANNALTLSANTTALASTTATSGGSNSKGNTTTSSNSTCVYDSTAQPGSIFLLTPNSNNVQKSAAVIGGNLNITWSYNIGTTIPTSIDIYWANVPSSNGLVAASAPTAATFYSNPPIATNIPGSKTTYIWKVTNLQPGNYELRIVGDNIDPAYYITQHPGENQCYKSNQAFPATSLSPFVVAGNNQLVTYPNNYGASNSATSCFASGLVLLVTFFIF